MYNAVDKFVDKKILIWGYGREGKSTEQFLKKLNIARSIDIYEGTIDGFNEDDYDYIFKSPGIVLEKESEKYTSQTELFLEQYRDQVIGITGTKGKSTTSSMLYKVLRECTDKEVMLMGNIGEPCLNYFNDIDENTIVVFEMSCHQMAHAKVSPHVAIFLNLFEEHLDYYGTMEKYFTAKSHVTTYQKESDYFFVGYNVPDIETKAAVIKIKDSEEHYELKILGKHNQYNAAFVNEVAVKIYGCDHAKVKESIENFLGLPHRLQYIGTVDGVKYYDDSISTIPEATINAIESIGNVQTALIGGMDRNIDYDILLEYIQQHRDINFICMYSSGKRIYDMMPEHDNCRYVEELSEAVKLAKEMTDAGNACVLSPAAASYGYFKNFEERGDVFKAYVLGNMDNK